MVAANLLGTASTLERIQGLIVDFYCGTPVRLVETEADTWSVYRAEDGKYLSGVIVRRQKKRFRFEIV